jgi:site-specific DNA recombinase
MKPIAGSRVRCAIYTRKSSEEGLEQSFNSLQAQREACEAYIASQRHEGWHTISKQFDDGGFSGGNMNRPALKQLLEDIAAGLIDTIVVYKVDRLTRSLTDFAKMVEAFDQKGVSFVSVTQQFNTTTSMGRLTLNVLLSFAQFEREVTGERIRDKIAASKKKGMWMGGLVPLGYGLKGRKLVVNPKEAKIVQEIFAQYLRLGSVAQLKRYLDQKRIRTKARTSANGRTFGGESYARGGLYKLLRNEVYIGKIAHRGQSYDGQQPAIVEPEIWDKVTALLAYNNDGKRSRGRRAASSPLIGILFDEPGNRYTPTHAVKSGRRYRYYTSQAVIRKQRKPSHLDRIPAQELEQLIYSRIHGLLSSPEELSSAFSELTLSGNQFQRIVESAQQLTATWPTQSSQQSAGLLQSVVTRVAVKESVVEIELDIERLAARLDGEGSESSTANDPPRGSASHGFRLACPLQLSHRRGELRLVLPNTTLAAEQSRHSVVRAIARSLQWKERIIAGEIYCKEQLAAEANMNASYVGRILRLGSLSPDIVHSAIRDHSISEYSVTRRFAELPFDWSKQRTALGLMQKECAAPGTRLGSNL